MQAVIYSNGNQECERAKTLLQKLNVEILEYKLNQHFSERGFVEEFGEEQNIHKSMLVSDTLVG